MAAKTRAPPRRFTSFLNDGADVCFSAVRKEDGIWIAPTYKGGRLTEKERRDLIRFLGGKVAK